MNRRDKERRRKGKRLNAVIQKIVSKDIYPIGMMHVGCVDGHLRHEPDGLHIIVHGDYMPCDTCMIVLNEMVVQKPTYWTDAPLEKREGKCSSCPRIHTYWELSDEIVTKVAFDLGHYECIIWFATMNDRLYVAASPDTCAACLEFVKAWTTVISIDNDTRFGDLTDQAKTSHRRRQKYTGLHVVKGDA